MRFWWLLFPSLLSLVSYLFLFIISLRTGVQTRLRGFFALFLLSMAVWSFGSMMMRLDYGHIATWNTVMLAGGAGIMPVTLFSFVQAFLNQFRRRLMAVGAISAAMVALITILGLMVDYVKLNPDGQIDFSFGPALPFYGTYWLFYVGVSFYSLVRAYKKTKDPVEQNRIRYTLVALGFVLVGATTNAVPSLGAFPIDHLANLIAASLLTYAIMRYRLLDIRLVIRKGLLYSIPTIIIGTVYFLIISASQALFSASEGIQLFLVSLGVAILTAMILHPLRDRAQQSIDRLFFRERYDSNLMLQRVSGAAASILDMEKLTEMLTSQVITTMQVERAMFFVKDHDTDTFHPMSSQGFNNRVLTPFRSGHPLIEWFERHDGALSSTDLALIPQFKALWGRELRQLEILEAELYLPMKAKRELVGIFIVGPKRSEQPFTLDEQVTLTSLANQVTMAVANARLYGEAQQEIHERRRAEEALRELSSRHVAILGAVPDIIMELNAQQRYVWTNQAGLDFFGANILNQRASFLDGQEGDGEDHSFLSNNAEPEYYVENWQQRYDGERRLLAWRCRALFDAEGQVTGALCTARDITENRRLEEKLRQSSKMEAIGQLAGGVAHDFNNLLTVINGYSDFLLESLDPHSPLRDDVNEIRQAGARAVDFTRQLLAFSRQQVIETRIINLNQVVLGMAKMLRRLIGEDINLVFNLADDLYQIRADPGQIEQVIVNLAVNARDAMLTGGTLVIKTSNSPLEKESSVIPKSNTGDYVTLAISDTGIGMEPEVQKHLFEPFFTTKKVGQGTGLGLATVYGIVNQSNGTIDVESVPRQGSTFRIYLPGIEQENISSEREEQKHTRLEPGLETVLVVEDEESVRRMTLRMLRRLGYHVLEAHNGSQALDIYQRHRNEIDLVLTDVVMPVMSGSEFVRQLEHIDDNVPVLYMSGYTDDVISHHGILDPEVDLLQKPFSLEQLAQRVRGVLDNLS